VKALLTFVLLFCCACSPLVEVDSSQPKKVSFEEVWGQSNRFDGQLLEIRAALSDDSTRVGLVSGDPSDDRIISLTVPPEISADPNGAQFLKFAWQPADSREQNLYATFVGEIRTVQHDPWLNLKLVRVEEVRTYAHPAAK
jgi:hypothetical protein